VLLLTLRPVMLAGVHGVVRLVASIALSGVLWLVTPYVLLARRVPWRRLGPMALLTAAGMTGLTVCSALWMPYTVTSSAAQFGMIGVAFALLTWLVGFGLVLVTAAAGGAIIDERLLTRHRG
jgi:membrane protein